MKISDFHRYFEAEMSQKEVREFQAKLDGDPAYRSDFEEFSSIEKAIVAERLRNSILRAKKGAIKIKRKSDIKSISIVGSALLFISVPILFIFYQNSKSQELLADKIQQIDNQILEEKSNYHLVEEKKSLEKSQNKTSKTYPLHSNPKEDTDIFSNENYNILVSDENITLNHNKNIQIRGIEKGNNKRPHNYPLFITPSVVLLNSKNEKIVECVELLFQNKAIITLQKAKTLPDNEVRTLIEASAYLIVSDIKKSSELFNKIYKEESTHKAAIEWGLGWIELLKKQKREIAIENSNYLFKKVEEANVPHLSKQANQLLNQ